MEVAGGAMDFQENEDVKQYKYKYRETPMVIHRSTNRVIIAGNK